MRRFIAALTITAVAMILVFASSAPVALAQNGDRIVVPPSSIVRPEDHGLRAHTNVVRVVPGTLEIGPNGAPVAENPASLACIYRLVKKTKGCPKTSTVLPTGGARAIAIVDAFDNPNAATDLATFAAAYGYGAPNFTVVKLGSPLPDAGWALESSLDIEYAFAMAPNAHIYLVEAQSNSIADLMAAVDKATQLVQAAGGGQVSNSWGANDFQGETAYDSHFQGQGVVYFASSGDTGGVVSYPSASPFVVSAGGTTILRNGMGFFTKETAWNDAGGGPSQFESRPSYQNVITSIVGTHRGTPDISSNAALASAVAVYSQSGCGGWCLVGGTSVSSPTIAGIVNAAGTFNTSSAAELAEVYTDYGNPTLYKKDFKDIKTGSNGYACMTGWDFCTGIGSPKKYKGK